MTDDELDDLLAFGKHNEWFEMKITPLRLEYARRIDLAEKELRKAKERAAETLKRYETARRDEGDS